MIVPRPNSQAAVIDPTLKAKLEELNKQGMLSDMGVSIRALGESAPGEVAGKKTNIVESLLRSRSVDFVTHAGAGGQVEMLESDRFDDLTDSDLDLVSEAELRRRRPDLVQLIESHAKEQQMTEKEIQDMKRENAELKAQVQEATTPYSELILAIRSLPARRCRELRHPNSVIASASLRIMECTQGFFLS